MKDEKLNLDGDQLLLKSDVIETGNSDGLVLPIKLCARKVDEDPEVILYDVSIDGVPWFFTESQMHAVVLYDMLLKHVMEYMHYESI